jgi:tetratricopeptide (TPR) repeat protein
MQHGRSLRRSLLLVLSLLSACAAAYPSPYAADSGTAGSRDAGQTVAGAFLAGRFAAMQSDLNFAADEFLNALAVDPDNPELRQQAFLACLMIGRPDTVRLAQGLPNDETAQLLLADRDAASGNWGAAESRFAALPRQGPTGGLTELLQPLLVAWAQQGAGHIDAALATLHPFIEGQRSRFIYALHGALIADLAGRTAEAGRLYRIAQAEYGPPTLELARLLASWQARQGHAAEAAETLRASTDANPELAIALPALQAVVGQRMIRGATDGLAEVYLVLAAALHQQDAGVLSMVMLRLAIELRPDDSPARLLATDIAEATKHPDTGLQLLAQVAADDPLIGIVRLHLASLTEQIGRPEDALHLLEQIERDYPNRPEAYISQGDILRTQHRYGEAVVAYDKAMAQVGTPTRLDWPLFYDRGIALEQSKDWPRAESDFLTALKLAPDQPYVLNYLGYSWTEQGHNLPRARQMIERAVEQRPNDGAIIDSLGWVMLRQGDTVGAVKSLERAVELMPEDATLNGHLGDAYWAAGRRQEALYQWRRALNLNPEPEDIPKLQAKLQQSEQALGIAAAPQTPPANPVR